MGNFWEEFYLFVISLCFCGSVQFIELHTHTTLPIHGREQLLHFFLFRPICYFLPEQESLGIGLSLHPGGLWISNIVLVSSLDLSKKQLLKPFHPLNSLVRHLICFIWQA